ncbi:MAG: efflux RND transporter permease subunit, partial [Candidatus Brocadiia bacterium]|nr:efflux RND transporter permease subunit [Candidatus Brocadiia bacterium]
VFAGAFSYATLPREAAPDVPVPLIVITTIYNGVSPEDVETSVTMKIEQELVGMSGLKEITSRSAESVSTIICEFEPEVIIEDALQYVRDRVDLAKPELPDDAEEPFIKEINIAGFPIMYITISGSISPVRMKSIAADLADESEAVGGVLEAAVSGALEREIRLEIDADRVAAYGLTLSQILALIPSENLNLSAGGLDTAGTRFNVRLPAEFADPSELSNLVLTTRGFRTIYLTDVARVCDTFKDRTSFSRLDGYESITIAVKKRIGANAIDISDQVKAILAAAGGSLPARGGATAGASSPEGLAFAVVGDESDIVRLMVSDLENNVASGLILVLVVLALFLGLRTSIVVALTIPFSMLISFALIQALGYTLNMIVLFSLVLSLGMLVDNAIVIVENIYRHIQLGYGKVEAATKGTAEVAWPVIVSTATTVAAFSPMLFWPGIIGDFMKYLPITLIITLSSSLFVALVISPTICSVLGGATRAARKRNKEGRVLRLYRRVLALAISYSFVTLALAVLLLTALVITYATWGRGVEFFPTSDPDRAMINIRSPQGTNIRESDRLARIVEERVEGYRAYLKHVVANVGAGGGNAFTGGGGGGAHVGETTMVFYDFEDRKVPSADIVAEVRRDLADIAGAEIKVAWEEHGPPTGAPVTLRIIGEDFDKLEGISEGVKRMIASVPGLVNLRSDLEATTPELVFTVARRRAKLLGIDPRGIGMFLKTAIYGAEVGTYREFDDEHDITVRLPLRQRTTLDDLLRLQVPNSLGRPVPLSSLGELRYTGGLGTIAHVDRDRVVTLTGDAEGRLGPAVLQDVKERLKDLELEQGHEIHYAGEGEEQEKAEAFLLKAFGIALGAILMILVTQFNSLRVPLIIMTTVVLSLVGVLAGLLAWRLPFGVIMTGIGVISLAGVVVNN